MRQKKSYDYERSESLNNYVRMKYRNQLTNGALQFYLLALPYLEKRRCGLCEPITADYNQLAEAGVRAAPRLEPILHKLNGVLCEVEIGTPINGNKKATRIRRYTLRELQSRNLKRKLVVTTPEAANRLADIMNERTFVYGENLHCHPLWDVKKTGRVQSSNPNVQGDPETVRIDSLKAGLHDDEILFSIDFKSAEPTITQQIIDFHLPEPPYEILARNENISRGEAKRKVNMLAYANSARQVLRHWQHETQLAFSEYAEALDSYKDKIWQSGKPANGKRRHTYTVGGSRIVADKGQQVHRGTVMNWKIQGTIADIINAVCMDVIDLENKEEWRLCYPVHDSIYAIGKPDHREPLEAIMQTKADDLNLNLTVKTQEEGRC